MKKSLQEIKELSSVGVKMRLIINVKDYTFKELLDMSKIVGLLGWKFTFVNATILTVEEIKELLSHADNNHLTFDFSV